MMMKNIPVIDKARDAAWFAFIQRPDVQQFFAKEADPLSRFPIARGWYEMWCQAWHLAWDRGFQDGMNTANQVHANTLLKQEEWK